MDAYLQSTKAHVSDVKAVKRILIEYETNLDVELRKHGKSRAGTLELAGGSWPVALQKSEWPDKDKYPDEDAWLDALFDSMYTEKGEAGFVALLLQLAPYLQTPLRIGVRPIGYQFWASAGEWLVKPQATAVETKEIHSIMDDEQ